MGYWGWRGVQGDNTKEEKRARVARRSQTVKVEGTKMGREEKKNVAGLIGRGGQMFPGSRCGLLKIGEAEEEEKF